MYRLLVFAFSVALAGCVTAGARVELRADASSVAATVGSADKSADALLESETVSQQAQRLLDQIGDAIKGDFPLQLEAATPFVGQLPTHRTFRQVGKNRTFRVLRASEGITRFTQVSDLLAEIRLWLADTRERRSHVKITGITIAVALDGQLAAKSAPGDA